MGPASISQLFEETAPLMAFAREAWGTQRHGEARRAVAACRVYLSLFAAPRHANYNPGAYLKTQAARLTDERRFLNIAPVVDAIGDAARVADCLRQFLFGAVLDEDTVLFTEILNENDVACAALSLDGPGRFPSEILIEGLLPISIEDLGRQWTLVTRGGRLDTTPNGLLLRLAGVRMPPEPLDGLTQAVEALERAEAALAENADNALAILDACIALLEGEPGSEEPVSLRAVLMELKDHFESALCGRGIAVDFLAGPDVPPIPLRRPRIRRCLASAFRYAMAVLPDGGGTLTVRAEYDGKDRGAQVLFSVHGQKFHAVSAFHLDGIRRAANALDAAYSFSAGESGAEISLTFVDRIGRILDAWIPGFEAFSEQSRQLLRLIKSGVPAPPEDFLLSGIIEAELERWLLPGFSSSAARTIAHELPDKASGLPGSSVPRIAKALGQLRRGKPRKEITDPSYAAEVLWLFRTDARRRKAVGAEHLDERNIEALCVALLGKPPDHAASLRLIARALTPAQ